MSGLGPIRQPAQELLCWNQSHPCWTVQAICMIAMGVLSLCQRRDEANCKIEANSILVFPSAGREGGSGG